MSGDRYGREGDVMMVLVSATFTRSKIGPKARFYGRNVTVTVRHNRMVIVVVCNVCHARTARINITSKGGYSRHGMGLYTICRLFTLTPESGYHRQNWENFCVTSKH